MDAVSLADVVAIAALLLNAAAIFFAARQLKAGRTAGSASSVISLHESLRQAWLRFKEAITEEDKQYCFADIMNLLEIGSASFNDKLFVGNSGKIIEKYLCHIFTAIEENPAALRRINEMLTTEDTFQNTVSFLKCHRAVMRKIALPQHVSKKAIS